MTIFQTTVRNIDITQNSFSIMQSFVFPGNIDPAIAAIGAEPIPYMRTQEFSDINLESERILLNLIHCSSGKAIIYTGSGTGAMSGVTENYVSTVRAQGLLLGLHGESRQPAQRADAVQPLYLQLHARLKQLEAQGGEALNISETRHIDGKGLFKLK